MWFELSFPGTLLRDDNIYNVVEITSVRMLVCVRVCVSAPEGMNN